MPQRSQRTTSVKLIERKRAFLDCLEEGFPLSHAYESQKVAKSTYYLWRKKDPKFKQESDSILNDPKTVKRSRLQFAKGLVKKSDDFRDTFYLVYLATGNKAEAADASGLSATEVEDMMDSSSSSFDEGFSGMVKEIRTRLLWEIEDLEMKRAKTDHKSAKFVLENLREEYKRKSPFGQNGQTNVFWFSSEGDSQAIKTLKQLIGDNRKERQVGPVIERISASNSS